MSKLKTQNHNSNLKTNLRYRAYNFSLAVVKLVSQLSNINQRGERSKQHDRLEFVNDERKTIKT